MSTLDNVKLYIFFSRFIIYEYILSIVNILEFYNYKAQEYSVKYKCPKY